MALVAMTVVLSSGCLLDIPLATAKKTLTEEFKTSDEPTIIVETFNGSIDVSPSNGGEVVVEVTKTASGIDEGTAEANLENVEVSMIQKENQVHISARKIDSHIQCGASVVISVPAAAQVKLKSSNGAIVSEGVHGSVEATSSNGKLEIIEGSGPLKLATSNGGVQIEATNAQIDARSSNGRVDFRGTLADGEHRLKTSNGKIRISLPADSRFEFDGSTSNSRIECEFPITADGKARRTRLRGTVGDHPACKITASTSNGGIELRKLSGD
jgi:DUF4097 and DUF4098 domain-containing protein YvlB